MPSAADGSGAAFAGGTSSSGARSTRDSDSGVSSRGWGAIVRLSRRVEGLLAKGKLYVGQAYSDVDESRLYVLDYRS